MLIYRFLSAKYALLALQTGTWKVGRLLELNDPLDCRPRLINFPPQPSDLAHSKFESDYLAVIQRKLGVLCYSASVNDPVVWSHYADSHCGIALGFDTQNRHDYLKVEYRPDNRRATLDYHETETAMKKADRKKVDAEFIKGFAVKANSWTYENEWRKFVRLEPPDVKMIGEHYFADLPKSRLVQVVLGVRCPVELSDLEGVIRVAGFKAGKGAPRLYRAATRRDDYDLDLTTVG